MTLPKVISALVLKIVLVYGAEMHFDNLQSVAFPASNSAMGVYQHAAVACDSGYCSTVGKNILQQGGSAVDAAIAALICNGVVNMHNLGIGGGFYAVVWDSQTGTANAFDSYGVSPAAFSNAMYLNDSQTLEMGKSSLLVPGEVAGYYEMHRRYGKLPWKNLFAPTILLCRTGFRVGPALLEGIDFVRNHQNLKKFPEMAKLVSFLKESGANNPWYREGSLIKCPELATTLEMIANNGASDFYNGTVASLILADLADFGVQLTKADLAAYQVNTARKPLSMQLRNNNLNLYTNRPSSSGAAAAFVLNILSDYNLTAADSQDALTYHRYLEAIKFAVAQRSYFGDESFVHSESDLEARLQKLVSPQVGRQIRLKINDSYSLLTKAYGARGAPSVFDDTHQSTSHISVLDADGNAVSLTSTINGHFGSLIMGKRTGIIFNNGMSNFALQKGKIQRSNNFIRPGKRPMTTISPMIFVKSGATPQTAVQLIVGASGSSRILCTVPYVAMRTLFFGESVKQAVDAYRFQQSLTPNVLYYEPQWPRWVLTYLRERGHVVQKKFSSPRSSISQAIQRLGNGTLCAISDFRKGGGYTDGY